MSATVIGAERPLPATPSLLRRLIAGPRQGWLAVLLVGVMVTVVGLAVDDTGWVLLNTTGQSATWWLPAAMLTAAAIGFLFGISRFSTAGSHLIAAGVGAAVILIAAAVSISTAPTLLGQLRYLSDSFSMFVNDVFVLETRSPEKSAPLIVIGALAWTTGYFAAFNVFRRNRGMAAVLSGGLVLLVNMSITSHAQYGYLIVFTLAAMLLLVRLNIVEQSVGWQRRHIGNADGGSALFLRGGAVFVTITVLGAVFLAATASSAPLAGAWQGLNAPLLNLGASLNQLVGGISGSTGNFGGPFGDVAEISGTWQSSDDPLFNTSTSDGSSQYWRSVTFEEFDGRRWYAQGGATEDVPVDSNVAAGSSERELADGPDRRRVVATITSIALVDSTLLAPDTLVTSNVPTTVQTAGQDGPIERIEIQGSLAPSQQYTVTSMVPNVTGDSSITASMLAAAGGDYPQWVMDRYLDIQPSSIGQAVYDTATEIRRKLPLDQRDAYHLAHAVQDYFTHNGFHYNTNVSALCGRQNAVDCLLATKQGYCEHYASAMTMMLRTLGIPARFVEGYLPGTLMADKVTYLVTRAAAHAWVEVYFPGYGWIRFDPTPGNADHGRVPTELPAGTPVSAAPTPEASIDAAIGTTPPSPEPTQDPNAAIVPPTAPPDPGAIGLYAVTAVIVVAIVLAFFSRRRRPSRLGGDQTFDRVARLAARLGYAPRPSQTAYEYAGALGEIVPTLKPELQVVATAKVEATYGRHIPTRTSLVAVHTAYARIRRSLFLLFFHPRRPKPPRS